MALDSVNPPSESILSGDEQRMALDLEDGEIEDGEIEDDEVTDTASKASVQKPEAREKAVPPKLEPPVIDASMAPRTREPALPRRREPLLPNPPASKRLCRPQPAQHQQQQQGVGSRPLEPDDVEDDWAGNVEKAIKAAMEKEKSHHAATEASQAGKAPANDDESDDRKDRRKKKRKKKYKEDEDMRDPKKHKKTHRKGDDDDEEAGRSDDAEENDGDDDDEMLYVRGASPVMKGSGSPAQEYHEYQQYHEMSGYDKSYDSYGDDETDGEDRRDYSPRRRREGSPPKRGMGRGFKRRPMRGRGSVQTRRPPRRDIVKGKRLPTKRLMRGNQEQGRDSVCVFFMQGKCQKGEDCPYSHDVNPPRKLELCKFYLNNCCAKKDKCLYMHNDFPCKFYHMGLKCFAGDRCKFSHGHLSETMRAVLLKHLETAPKEILGDFPRMSREGANAIMLKKNRGKGGADSRKIPSLFEIEVPLPVQLLAEEKSRRESPGTPVPGSDDEEQDGCHTPMPSSPKSDSVFSAVGKGRRWDQDDVSDQSRHLHIDEDEEGVPEQGPETTKSISLGEEESGKRRRNSEKKSKRKRDSSSQRTGASRGRSGEDSGEDAELRRSHKEERQLKKRLKEESKRNAKEEKRLRKSLREERRKRSALEKEKKARGSSVELKQESCVLQDDGLRDDGLQDDGLQDDGLRDDGLRDDAQARSNSPWEEPDYNYGRLDHAKQEPADFDYGRLDHAKQEPADFDYGRPGTVEAKQEPADYDYGRPGTGLLAGEELLDVKFEERHRSSSEEDDAPENGQGFLHMSVKQEIPALDTESGTDSNDGAHIPIHLPKKQRELFLRIQQQQREAGNSQDQSDNNEKDGEQAEEENWYSSDEEEASLADVLKNLSSQKPTSAGTPEQGQGTSSAAPSLGGLDLSDLSRIDISESVSRLLSSIRYASASTAPGGVAQTTAGTAASSSCSGSPSLDAVAGRAQEQSVASPGQAAGLQVCVPSVVRDPRLLRDPRSRPANTPAAPGNPPGLLSPSSVDGRRADPRSSKVDDHGRAAPRRSSVVDAPNVYGNAITSPSQTMGINLAGQGDLDLRTMEGVADVDLRTMEGVADVDLRRSSSYGYGDTDLRLSAGPDGSDVDLRKVLGLPFKPVPMHMPATEIDASLTSHPPIPYKLVVVTIPRPDYSKLKINPSDPQVFRDPRLRKLFKLPLSPPQSSPAVSAVFSAAPAVPVISASRADPRRARAAAQQALPCQDLVQQPQVMQQLQPQMPPVQPDMFVPVAPQPPMMVPSGMMAPEPMLGPPRPGPTPGLLGVAPPGFLSLPQMGYCPPPTPRFEDEDDEDGEDGTEGDVDLRRMYGWEQHQGRPGHARGNRRRWRGGSNNRRRRANHSTPA